MVCTLGNFATKLLRGDPTGITRLHGRPEVRTIGPRTVRLLPLYHPAAALYTRSLLDTLREDFAQIPRLLALEMPAQPAVVAPGARAGGGARAGPRRPWSPWTSPSSGCSERPTGADAARATPRP